MIIFRTNGELFLRPEIFQRNDCGDVINIKTNFIINLIGIRNIICYNKRTKGVKKC